MLKQKTVSLGPFTDGLVNTARDYVLPKSAALDILNLDVTDEGNLVSRQGYSQTVAVDNGHSLSNQGDKVLFANGSELGVITALAPLAMTTLRTGLQILPISYAELGERVWWSNGTDSGRCNENNTDSPWALPTPDPLTSVFAGVGTLPVGEYRLALTYSMADGEMSAGSEIYSFTQVSDGSIELILPSAPAGVEYTNVFCTVADGDVLHRAVTVTAATGTVSITAMPEGMELGERAFCAPMPAGEILAVHGGRLLSATGRFLFYSNPFDFGQYCPAKNYLHFPAGVSIVAPCEGGVFIVADKTYWYDGADIATAGRRTVLNSSGVKGTKFDLPIQRSVGWFSNDGFVIGAPDGSVSTPQVTKGFKAPVAISGNTQVRQTNGMTHLVCSLDDTSAYNKEVSVDFTVARNRYADDQTTVVMNFSNHATSRYSNWYFNSTALIDGEWYGCDSVGLRKLEGAKDETTEIRSVVDLGRVGYESLQIKSPENIYVAGKSSAPVVAEIFLPSNRSYAYPARNFSTTPTMVRIDGMKGLMNERAAWFSTVVRNNTGPIEISAVQVLVNESSRKI